MSVARQQQGIFIHGDKVVASPIRGGLVPAHGGLSPKHGDPNLDPAVTYNPALRVILPSAFRKARDISPILRNSNNTARYDEVKIGPSALCPTLVNGLYQGLFEAIQATGFTANNGMTAYMRATAAKFGGPWTVSPDALVLAAQGFGTWEQNEFSPADAYWDGVRWIIVNHGGNNAGPREGGVSFCSDINMQTGFTRNVGNPTIVAGATGAYDDKQAGGDLKTIWEPALGLFVGFGRVQKNGAPTTDGLMGRYTSPDFINWTKTGQPFTTAPSWNAGGRTSGKPWRDAGGRYHMLWPGGAVGIGLSHSDDYGVTWTDDNSGNAVCSASGIAGSYDQFGSGDVVQTFDLGDALGVIYGTENISTYSGAGGFPMRGQSVGYVPLPKVTPTRKGKWYTPSTWTAISSTSLMNQTIFTVMFRFKARRMDRSKARYFYTSEPSGGTFNKNMYIRIADNSSGNAGKVDFFFRTPTAIAQCVSTSTYEDEVWHYVVATRIGASSFSLIIDNGAAVTSVTSPATDATAVLQSLGNWNSATAEPDGPSDCAISDMGIVTGYAAGYAEAKAWMDSRTALGGGAVVFDQNLNGVDSGNVVLCEAA